MQFGARVEYVTENGTSGCKVKQVARGTSLALKLQEKDLIVKIGNSTFASTDEFTQKFLTYSPNQEVQLTVLRGKKKLVLKAKAVARPYETDDNATVIYDEVAYKGGQLRVIINKPFKENKMPAMLFIPEYTCSSIDDLPTYHPYKRIVDAYVDAGYVTLRVEKSGLGDSKNTPPCESCDLLDEIENFEVGLKKLKSLPYVDPNQIIIVGHSMGGIVAPAISAKNKVAGVVVYGTTAKSWFEYQIEMYRVQNALSGMNPIEVEQSVIAQYDLNYRYFVKKEKLEDIAKETKADSILRTSWEYDGKGKIYSRNAEYWRQIQDYPHLENWKNTTAKVLVQYGESDFQAFSKTDHQQIVNTVNFFNPGNATLMTYPSTDHFYAKSGTMQEAYNKFSNGQIQQLFDEYNQEVGLSAVKWSNEVLSKKDVTTLPEKGWKKLNTERYPGKQDDITFINEKEGWYVNGYGSIYNTKNSGETWEKQLEKKGTFFRTIAFVDNLVGFAGTVGTDYFPNVTDSIPLYGTRDGGKTWKPVDYKGPYVKGLCAIDIVKEQYINHGKIDYKIHIYAVGRVGSPANMMVSHDGGATWTSNSMNNDCKMLFDIKMFDKNNGFVCAASDEDMEKSNALILKTSDGGKTWKKVYQSNRPFEGTWKASFPTKEVGYVTIQSYNPDPSVKQQRIAKTTDGGETWNEINLVEDAGAREFGIGFIDENHGFVGTMNTGYETKDGGKTWAKVNLGMACNKIRIYKDANGKVYGYAIGVDVLKGEF
ncbi:alpha/beta fold hydrolase [Flavobacterium macrobrachii]|uniref:PDZ domain-containing protein n=1 Tax=Flavobacterium macrobrachii TaxID=591204 RepID=A0ABS2CTY1_9FLAO|nr:alpha/beta fold hydrolase [Flavobacterium macrobrachii]MBM6498437.1 PDZ domain-containing protein [Flavobacterium macrobrachii]